MLRIASSDIPKSMMYSILWNQFISYRKREFFSNTKICPDDETEVKKIHNVHFINKGYHNSLACS